tara:strand:+ start:264 stop:434 length:171 start_codon:yes stop_codon:yes gene_type:complete
MEELQTQLNQAFKLLNKYGKYIEELEKEVALLKKDSHPPQEYVCCKECGCKIAKIK